MAYSIDKLAADLQNLGIKSGDILLVHCGFRNINAESPAAVVAALEKAVGSEGTLVMPSFPGGSEFMLAQSGAVVDTRTRPSDCGIITETFRKMPGVIRSLSPGHCMAARGKLAEELMRDHEKCLVSAGWGSPFEKIIARRGKIVMIGTDNSHNTTLHYVENTHGAPTVSRILFYPSVIDREGKLILVPTYPHMPGLPRRYGEVDAELNAAGIQQQGKFGDAELRVIDAFEMNEFIGDKIEKDHCYLIRRFSLDGYVPADNLK